MATEQHRQALLESSGGYATAKLAFANAIVIARRAGMTDEEIGHVTGLPATGSELCSDRPDGTPPPVPRDREGVGVP